MLLHVLVLAIVLAVSPLPFLLHHRDAVPPSGEPEPEQVEHTANYGDKDPEEQPVQVSRPDRVPPTDADPDKSAEESVAPTDTQPGEDPAPISQPSDPDPSPEPTPSPGPAPTPDSEPEPQPDPEPEPEPEPAYEDGSADQLDYWLSNAEQISPSSVLTPGVTYCIARPVASGQYRVMYFRMQFADDQYGKWWKVYRGIVDYYINYNNVPPDESYDTVFDGTVYHFYHHLTATAGATSGYQPGADHKLLHLGGGTAIEAFYSEDGALTRGPVLSHFDEGPLFNEGGELWGDLTPFRDGTLIPCTDPGLLRAVEYAIAVCEENNTGG